MASRRRTGDCTDSCTAAATYGASDDRSRYRATCCRTLRECVLQRYGHRHTQEEQRKYNPTHWGTPLMLDFPIRAFPSPLLTNWPRLCDLVALQRFLFEFHFINAAVEAQEKLAATLTCLLNESSTLMLVVMGSLATCL
ncbi:MULTISPECIES: hypothetical protein [unclassified Bradyrhizobium]|uniref:hypothetical protein n=1 Tax=unclassified Bradyrhizobium TaxID=2631580 RepID=UPI00289B7C5D|nr:hypothetical protein [Bradyrhizobium sp. AUGA SZCCT0182]